MLTILLAKHNRERSGRDKIRNRTSVLGACRYAIALACTLVLLVPLSVGKSGENKKMREHCSGTWTPGLTEAEKTTLLAIAWDSLSWCAQGRTGDFPMDDYNLTPELKTTLATFVTLKRKGDLRGCIGSLEAVEPLYLSVHHNAVNAAKHDPRFPPVRAEEVAGLTLDISVLSPLSDISGPGEFKVGRHGVILSKSGYRAVFLPEVALEQKWTREETLSFLSCKAGLPADAWKSGARFKVFESYALSRE